MTEGSRKRVGRAGAIALACVCANLPFEARAADPQPYTIEIAPTGDGDLDAALQTSSLLVTLKDKVAVAPFALIARAISDADRLQTAAESLGYYAARPQIAIDGKEPGDPNLPTMLESVPQGQTVPVTVRVTPGPRYKLRKIEFQGIVPISAQSVLSLHSGDNAVAADVLAGRDRVLAALLEDGYALAKIDAPVVRVDDQARVLDVTYPVDTGLRVRIGKVTITGLKDVREQFVHEALDVQPGDLYQTSKIERARSDLSDLGVFRGIAVRAADHLDSDGHIPLTFDVDERPLHTVAFTAAYSTDLGASVSVSWSHRNLFGDAEQLNLKGGITGLGGDATPSAGYNVAAQYIEPLFLERHQLLELDLAAIKQDLDAYDQKAFTASAYVKRRISDLWGGSVGVVGGPDQITQEGVTRDYPLIAAPVSATYDSTQQTNPLYDPVRGGRALLQVTPTHAFGSHSSTFAILQASGSIYFDVSYWLHEQPGLSVLASRGVVGTIQGATQLDLPPDQRLYAGGSGTVRGFAYQSIGPQFPDGKPVGATSVDAGTIEFRQRFLEDYGVAVFVDAGQASANSAPFTGTLEVGAGLGGRYYTSIGPVRLDVAFPLTSVPHGDAFELYIGLGQAF
jgi:translocation and assembly module TamA